MHWRERSFQHNWAPICIGVTELALLLLMSKPQGFRPTILPPYPQQAVGYQEINFHPRPNPTTLGCPGQAGARHQ
jgi:hypothetical protein